MDKVYWGRTSYSQNKRAKTELHSPHMLINSSSISYQLSGYTQLPKPKVRSYRFCSITSATELSYISIYYIPRYPHYPGLATRYMYFPWVACGSAQCDEVVQGLLAGRALTLGTVGTSGKIASEPVADWFLELVCVS